MKPTTRVPSFEALETRTLMSGTVTATVSGGNLVIAGDANDNDISISKAGTVVTVTGNNGTVINQVGNLNQVTGTIKLTMGDGDDTAVVGAADEEFSVFAPAAIPSLKDFSADMGAGDDSLTIFALSARNVVVTTGIGNNTTELNGGDNGSVISGTLTITNGTGDDTLLITGDITVTKACTINNGAGTNETTISDDGTSTPGFAKTLSVIGGGDSDTFIVDASTVGDGVFVAGLVTLNMGAGNNEFDVDMMTAGTLTYTGTTGDDAINPEGTEAGDFLTVRKGLTLAMGAGNNTLNLMDLTVSGGSFVYTGSTTGDAIAIDGEASVRGSMTLTVGNGTNDVTIDTLTVSGAFTYTGGTGSDTFTSGNELDIVGHATFTMAAGQNTLDLASASFNSNLTYAGGANGDHVTLNDTDVAEITKITTLAGDDDVTISAGSSFLGAFTLDTSAGDDTVDIASEAGLDLDMTSFLDAVSILTGDGNDIVTIGAARTNDNAVRFFDEKTKFDGGAGLNDILARTDVLFSFDPVVAGFETF